MLRGQPDTIELDALVDTGFDGDVLLPAERIPTGTSSARETRWRLADGTRVVVPTYVATLRIGDIRVAEVAVIARGDEALIGRGVTRHFTVTFDHDRQVIVEP